MSLPLQIRQRQTQSAKIKLPKEAILKLVEDGSPVPMGQLSDQIKDSIFATFVVQAADVDDENQTITYTATRRTNPLSEDTSLSNQRVGNGLRKEASTIIDQLQTYCLRCKHPTGDKDALMRIAKNGCKLRQSHCEDCGSRKSRFLSKSG